MGGHQSSTPYERKCWAEYIRRIRKERKERKREERRKALGLHPTVRRRYCEECETETIHVKSVCCHAHGQS